MKNQLFRLWACLALILAASCEKQEQAEAAPADYFITGDLSFLTEELSGKGGSGWPANGCKSFDVKIKMGFLEAETTLTNCCVNYVCNFMEANRIIDFFLGDKSGKNPTEVEIISSEIVIFKHHEIRIHPGKYPLDAKSGKLKDIEYEVWVNRP